MASEIGNLTQGSPGMGIRLEDDEEYIAEASAHR